MPKLNFAIEIKTDCSLRKMFHMNDTNQYILHVAIYAKRVLLTYKVDMVKAEQNK